MDRHSAREKAFQVLFQIDINEGDPITTLDTVLEGKDNDEFLHQLVTGVVDHKEDIDKIIEMSLENWKLKRIASVEKTALRIATYEMKFMDDIPINVSINEAIELTNKYGEEKSGKFINGVLSKINENL